MEKSLDGRAPGYARIENHTRRLADRLRERLVTGAGATGKGRAHARDGDDRHAATSALPASLDWTCGAATVSQSETAVDENREFEAFLNAMDADVAPTASSKDVQDVVLDEWDAMLADDSFESQTTLWKPMTVVPAALDWTRGDAAPAMKDQTAPAADSPVERTSDEAGRPMLRHRGLEFRYRREATRVVPVVWSMVGDDPREIGRFEGAVWTEEVCRAFADVWCSRPAS